MGPDFHISKPEGTRFRNTVTKGRNQVYNVRISPTGAWSTLRSLNEETHNHKKLRVQWKIIVTYQCLYIVLRTIKIVIVDHSGAVTPDRLSTRVGIEHQEGRDRG